MNKFKDAFNGIRIAIDHTSVKIQFVLGFLTIIIGIIIGLDYYEWLAFIICISMVIVSEVFNTAIEKIGDYLNIEKDEKIKTIKDLSSGAVLISAIASTVIFIFCLIRRLK